ncbi:MAG TPA: nucleotidyl transferase AbiEii/AbiGii toxin family protein [Thermoanaerobaculia bacterium]|nr:nucleotidyl transferase AbiEii/AbiGii toxin family protein [Thermoanaerobaculia bacterium]
MRKTFDRRVVPDFALGFLRACQTRVPCHLGGGAALAGVYLGHRTTGDLDLFVHDSEDMRALARLLPDAAADAGTDFTLLRDAGHLVRAQLEARDGRSLEVDLVYEPIADIEAPPPIEGVVIESLADIRASKLTCILSRSEPRDLVDLYFLDQVGFPPAGDLEIALRKDSGIDPGVLAWLVAQFPTRPLPAMLKPLTTDQLEKFRDLLAETLRRSAIG